MRRNLAFVLALCAFGAHGVQGLGAADAAQTANAAGQYYCPPGAKFCPAPGTDNTVFLDTHFGMDAQTGQVTAYTGNVHPNDVSNPPMTGERVLYVSPPISVENRYVPPSDVQASGMAYGQPAYQPFPQPAPYVHTGSPYQASGPAQPGMQSEVANVQADRSSRDMTANDRKVPWYKGGVWRNRRRSSPAPTASSSGSAPVDDMWDDDDFGGYNPDGGFAQGGYTPDPYASQQFAAPAAQGFGYDPYAAPAPRAAGGGYVSDPYTLPDSPPPTSPYQAGYVYPGTTYSEPVNTQAQYMPPPAPQGGGYTAGAPSGYDSAPRFDPGLLGASMPVTANPGPMSQGFEQAVNMVKENRFTEAKSLLLSETQSNPGNAAAWRWLGDCHYNLLELDNAITSYQRALERDANDYYAMRGQGFAYLHRGHEYWRRMQEEVAQSRKEEAASTFAQAHENYKRSLELLGLCLRRAPNDSEAIYGEAMAAEGASRKLYSNAVSYLKLGPENRERAELFAENCLTVINKGVERARERARLSPGESGPRALLGGLYLRRAILYHQLGKTELALIELRNARDVQQSILDEIDKNNATAQKSIRECENYWESWGGDNS